MSEIEFTSLAAALHREGDQTAYTQLGYFNHFNKCMVCCDTKNPETSINVYTWPNEKGDDCNSKRISYEEAVDILYDWTTAGHKVDVFRCDEMLAANEELLQRKEELKAQRIEERRQERLITGKDNVIKFPG